MMSNLALAQTTFNIKGKIVNENKQGIPFVEIYLLHENDSAKLTYATSSAQGSFELNAPKGNYTRRALLD